MVDNGAVPVSDETFDLSDKLRQRLRETNAERERTQAKIVISTEQLQRMYKHVPKRPRETIQQLDARISKLEHERTTTSISLSSEKKILREMDQIKKIKKEVGAHKEHESAIQGKKSEIAALKDNLRTVTAAVAELEAALSKVELAKKLGCTTADLKIRVVDCPEGKIGHVIGRNGAALKQLEERCVVHVDIDKVGSKIHLHGSDEALDLAVVEVENITLAIEEDVELPSLLVTHLMAKRSAKLNKVQEDHPDVHIDFSRNGNTAQLRGRPEKVVVAKNDLLSFDVKKVTRKLEGRETAFVVGKGGATVNRLVDDHDVVINISNTDSNSSEVEIIGFEGNINAALSEIEDILYKNEEIEEILLVQPMQRNKLLENSGATVKVIQAEINNMIGSNGIGVLLVFEKRPKEDMHSKDLTKLAIKTSRMSMKEAKKLVQKHIDAFDSKVRQVDVEPSLIPAIIGKGGANINALRKECKGADVDVDKDTGVIKIFSNDDETKEVIVKAIEKIVAENQTTFVEVEQNVIGAIFGEVGKEMRNSIIDGMGVNIGIDPSDSKINLRGTVEKITEAAKVLEEFIADNFTSEFDVSPDDEALLFHGGSDSLLNRIEADHDVKANFRKQRHVLAIRGREENVNTAVEAVSKFFNGGDGFGVEKLKVPEGVLGIVIGKGGGNISKLEKDYEGINIHVHRNSNYLSIRGPVEKVNECRVDIITLMATSRVTELVPLSPGQHEILAQPDIMKKITNDINVNVTLSDASLKIRGVSTDVADTKAILMEHLTGEYEASVILEPSQFSKVSAAVRDPSHFERIRKTTNASIRMDSTESAIIISGKRSSVKKAKTFLTGVLDFLLPSQFAKVKVPKPLVKSMNDPAAIAKISADSGSTVSFDRDLHCFQVQSSKPDSVFQATKMLKARLSECEKLVVVVRLDASDLWLLPKIIGKGGETVKELQEESGCKFDISKEELLVAISGESEDAVSTAKASLDKIIEQARKECVFVNIPDSAMSAFIGKGGTNIRQLAEDHDVDIERLRKEPSCIRIQGDEASVEGAHVAVIAWLNDWEASHVGKTVELEEAFIPAILGKQGSTVSTIQRATRCKIDIDRRGLTLTVRGGDESNREEALNKVNEIIDEEKKKILERGAEILENKKKKNVSNESTEAPDSDSNGHSQPEFASRPVGLTIGESKVIKPNNSKNPTKKKDKITGDNKPSNKSSTAAQNLFNLLVSDPRQNQPTEVLTKGSEDGTCDSSTSSATGVSAITEINEDNVNDIHLGGHYKSSSGFSVRV
mmetsp:Transcript_37996/g.55519  ORF Transcript_37996/g.55519 Transcript_37996/m.55519 type:complete len:1279 (-) Transcript_37996:332-4168(-)